MMADTSGVLLRAFANGCSAMTGTEAISNGIPAFRQSWKNVVATFYHELNEARTDPDVEDANRTGDLSKVGWYANVDHGGEIGDIPMNEAGAHLSLVFKEIDLADGSGTVPVQLMWSNKDFGPSSNIA